MGAAAFSLLLLGGCTLRMAGAAKEEPVLIICAISRCHVATDSSGVAGKTVEAQGEKGNELDTNVTSQLGE